MTSNPHFNDQTTGTEAAAALSKHIQGKNVVITGVSPVGIGAATAFAIASQSPGTLILASRTRSKLDTVAAQVSEKHPNVTVKAVTLDLGSIESVRKAAAEIESLVDHIDVLINNAAVNLMERSPVQAPDGTTLDQSFFTNHVGTWLFTILLLPLLRAAAAKSDSDGATRVVNLSSHGHRLSPIRFSDLAFQKDMYTGVPEAERPFRRPDSNGNSSNPMFQLNDGFNGFIGYGQSKTANILTATELSRRLAARGEAGIRAFACHPGTIETELSRHLDPQGRDFIARTAPAGKWKSQDQGCATTVVAAFDPALGGVDFSAAGTIGYLADCQLADGMAAPHARDPEMAARLWTETEKMLQMESGL